MLQSEIFDRLLGEAEQMHIKRKEATEMLKVQQRIQCHFSEKFKILIVIHECAVVHGHGVSKVTSLRPRNLFPLAILQNNSFMPSVVH